MPYQALVKGMSMSIPPKIDSLDMAAENLAAGEACVVIDGNVTKATVANNANRSAFVPTESKDNSGGSAGDLKIAGVGQGQRVTVVTSDALNPYDFVKISATDGKVAKWVKGSDAENLKYGKYINKETNVWSRNATTPFTETFSGDEISPRDAAAEDVVIIELLQRG